MKKLFIVEVVENKPTILGTLMKNNLYRYIPFNKGHVNTGFRWAAKRFESDELPLFIKQRVFSPHNVALPKFLDRLGLEEYDPWEILIRTKGARPGDSLRFLTEKDILMFVKKPRAKPKRAKRAFCLQQSVTEDNNGKLKLSSLF